jgi:hypothetical protein
VSLDWNSSVCCCRFWKANDGQCFRLLQLRYGFSKILWAERWLLVTHLICNRLPYPAMVKDDAGSTGRQVASISNDPFDNRDLGSAVPAAVGAGESIR